MSTQQQLDNNIITNSSKDITTNPPRPPRRARFLHKYGNYSSTHTHPIALWWEKWSVRLISFPVLVLLWAIAVVLYPIMILIALPVDIYRYNKLKGLVCCRIATFFLVYFTLSIVGILSFFSVYLVGLATSPSNKRWMKWNYTCQSIWGTTIFFNSCVKALGLQIEVKPPQEGFGKGPKILFMRHASFADTVLPQGIFGDHEMRYIVKKELLWDPVLNVGGTRLPNFFLYREVGQGGIDVEMDAIRNLVADLSPDQTTIVTIWPEGTRFTFKKRERVLESLKVKDPKAYEVASHLRYTLLPRLGGALALLEANPCADVLFCSHVGLEGATEIEQVLSGRICNQKVKVKFTRVKYADIPKTKEERIEWMYKHWQEIDTWVGKHQRPAEIKKRE